MYENNIKLHYIEYIERYINILFNKKEQINNIKNSDISNDEKTVKINTLCNELRKIKNDILDVEITKYKSNTEYHSIIDEQKNIIIPNKKFKKNSLYYDLQCSPFDYLKHMIYMMKYIEEKEISIYNVFPLRSDIIPKHIRIDTTTLVHTLLIKKYGNKSDYLFNGNLKRNEDKIWEFFFRTERKCFKKNNYSFHHMIETDGVSCSILLIRNDMIGKKINIKTKGNNEKYIDDVDNYNNLKNKKIVAIDPGKNNLICCVDDDNKNANVFRYTADQRRKETKSKKYNKIILEYKEEKIDGKNIIEYETYLSKFNRKSLIMDNYIEYIREKNRINNILLNFYGNYIFRKLKLNGYINRKKNEQKMINKFEKIFGNNNDVIVCFGDFEQKKHMKYKEPTKGKGIRTLFNKNGYKTYLVDEFRTSCKCSICEGGECHKFMIRENPKPYRNNSRLVHGLLRCKNECGLWNRDINGATNIYKIVKNQINGKERPLYLSRKKLSVVLDDTTKPQFTRPETGKPF